MKISELADQVRGIPLRNVLEHYGFEVKREGTTLRARGAHHNIVVTGNRWFDNKAGIGGGGAIDLVIHLTKVDFSAACRSLADAFLPVATRQTALSFPKSWRESPHPKRKSQFTRRGWIPTGRSPEPTSLNSARSRPYWWTKCTPSARSTRTIIGLIRALFSFIETSMARCAGPLFGIPNISPYSARALEISSPPGLRSGSLPRRTA